jgi:glycosyltransferase involved in cell wall biosynthesis
LNFEKKKILRTATVSVSLDVLLKGQLAFLSKYYEVVAVSGQDSNLEEVAKREKVKTIAVNFQRQISPIKDLVSLIKLYRVLKNEKPYIVHSITPKAGLITMVAAYFAKVPIRIHTFTGLVFPSKNGFMKQLLLNLDRILCFFATHIYPEGEGVKNDLINNNVTKKPLKVIANGNVNGIDTNYFNASVFSNAQNQELKNKLGISETDFIFVFVGRLVKDKGINELIAAFEFLQKEKSNVKLLLVGNFETNLDPLFPKTIAIIKENPAIISVGFQDDVRPYFAISNVLVFPSYREGFPNVVLQAGAMGLASIVTNINGCNEIVSNKINGLIIPKENQLALYEAMKNIINDAFLLNQMQKNARQMIVSRYEQSMVWESILQEYNSFEKNV